MQSTRLFSITLGLLMLVCCASYKLTNSPKPENRAVNAKASAIHNAFPEKFLLEKTHWKLRELISPDGRMQAIKHDLTIYFENDFFKGKTFCRNYYGGTFLKLKKIIYVTDIKQTFMGCGDNKLESLEEQFSFVMYFRVNRYEIQGSELMFYSPTNQLVMHFVGLQ